MSRHQYVKALNLEEELDDFDGGYDEEYESLEDKEQLRDGTFEVRRILGPKVSITDQQIQDSLYYYYYDIAKTVDYLQKKSTKPVKKVSEKPAAKSVEEHDSMDLQHSLESGPHMPIPFSAAEFFRDAPWLDIPEERRASIVSEPLHPPGSLLGGTSSGNGPPRSKLAALAAARKKENCSAVIAPPSNSSVALLERLNRNPDPSLSNLSARKSTKDEPKLSTISKSEGKKYPLRQQKRPPSPAPSPPPALPGPPVGEKVTPNETEIISAPTASPSIFADVIFGPASSNHSAKALDSRLPKSRIFSALEPGISANHEAFAGPSPDDVVLKAQSSAKGAKPAKTTVPKSQESGSGNVTQALNDVTITESAPRVSSKNIDVLGEYSKSNTKNAANFVVIGHVDAGKSTLMGRLLHDLKVVDKRTLDKYQKEADKIGKPSFALAFVMDQGTEERERGVTIDIANHRFETEKTAFTILDAPGHRDFIPNMIAGASQADFAVLVIDASMGNFESGLKGQTKEHALLVRSMGVQRVIIVVNKLDTIQWSQDRFDEISQHLTGFLTAAGLQGKNLSFVPCSGLTGDNIVRKSTNPHASWYTGPPLIELLESSEPFTRALEKPLRFNIDDVFRGGVQHPLSVSGRLEAGTVQTGDTVIIVPASQTASIKGIEVDNEPADWAVAGQNVILHLTDIDGKYLRSGDVLCAPSSPMPCVKSFTMKMLAFEHVMPMHCEVHKGRLHAPGRISKLNGVLDKSGVAAKGKKPKLIKPGVTASVTVEVDDAVPLELGSRVILRAEGVTVGAGLVQ